MLHTKYLITRDCGFEKKILKVFPIHLHVKKRDPCDGANFDPKAMILTKFFNNPLGNATYQISKL